MKILQIIVGCVLAVGLGAAASYLGMMVERARRMVGVKRGELITHVSGRVYLVAGTWMAATELKRTVRGATAHFRDLRALSEHDAIMRAEGCLAPEFAGKVPKKVQEFSMKLPPKPENKLEPGEGQGQP